jgi:hypothetical protein
MSYLQTDLFTPLFTHTFSVSLVNFSRQINSAQKLCNWNQTFDTFYISEYSKFGVG